MCKQTPFITTICFIFLTLLVSACQPVQPATGLVHQQDKKCADFEDLQLGGSYLKGSTVATSGVLVVVMGDGGTVEREDRRGSCGIRHEIELSDVAFAFDFIGNTVPITGLNFLFGNYGGDLYIYINGESINFDDFVEINERTIGGVDIHVAGSGRSKGSVSLKGGIQSFKIGGHSLWIDDICLLDEDDIHTLYSCISFDDLSYGTRFQVGDKFNTGNTPSFEITVDPLVLKNNNTVTSGSAFLRINQKASDCGSGNGIWFGGERAGIALDGPLASISFVFNYRGKPLNFGLGVNGSVVTVDPNGSYKTLDEIDKSNIPDIDISFISAINETGQGRGSITLEGKIDNFIIEGNELWIDNLCLLEP